MEKPIINIFWFRRELRLEDNHALSLALKEEIPVQPIFIFDTEILKEFSQHDDRRITFIYKTLESIHQKLGSNNSGIIIFNDTAQAAFEKITELFDVKKLFFNEDYEPQTRRRDENITQQLQKKGITVVTVKDHVIFSGKEILKSDGLPYTVFTPYMKTWKKNLTPEHLKPFDCSMKNFAEYIVQMRFPTLKELGFSQQNISFSDSELPENIIQNYEKTRDFPALQGTSRLGIHFRFGTISIRKAVRKALQLNEQWLNELIWREFFMQLLWHFPHTANEPYKKYYSDFPWINNEKEFERWCRGETGYSIVDAAMHELVKTGFMHNRSRMIAANFLTKILLIDWRWGELFFKEHLLDYELSSNCGNWQWAAGTGADAAPYFRIFNPTLQTQKFDRDMEYIYQHLTKHEIDETPQMIDFNFARQRCLNIFKQFRIKYLPLSSQNYLLYET